MALKCWPVRLEALPTTAHRMDAMEDSREIIPVEVERAEQEKASQRDEMKDFVASFSLDIMPACPVGMRLLLEFAKAPDHGIHSGRSMLNISPGALTVMRMVHHRFRIKADSTGDISANRGHDVEKEPLCERQLRLFFRFRVRSSKRLVVTPKHNRDTLAAGVIHIDTLGHRDGESPCIFDDLNRPVRGNLVIGYLH